MATERPNPGRNRSLKKTLHDNTSESFETTEQDFYNLLRPFFSARS
jgi:hypothetical protein